MHLQRPLVVKYAVIAFVVLVAVHHADATAAHARLISMDTTAAATPAEAQPTSRPVQSTLQQKSMANLPQAGFTDLKILAGSLLVQDEDPAGHPMRMFVRSA